MEYLGVQSVSKKTRSKIYRCDSDKAAMVAHDLVTSKCQKKVKYEWNNGYKFKCSDIQMFKHLNVKIFKCQDIWMSRYLDVQILKCPEI